MNADVHKRAKINNIADGTLQNHFRFQILHAQYIASQNRFRHFITGIAGRLLQLFQDIRQSHLADALCSRQFFDIHLFADSGSRSGQNVFRFIAQLLQHSLRNGIAFRVNRSCIQRIVSLPDAKKSGALLISLRSQLCNLEKLFPVGKPSILLTVSYNVLCHSG